MRDLREIKSQSLCSFSGAPGFVSVNVVYRRVRASVIKRINSYLGGNFSLVCLYVYVIIKALCHQEIQGKIFTCIFICLDNYKSFMSPGNTGENFHLYVYMFRELSMTKTTTIL